MEPVTFGILALAGASVYRYIKRGQQHKSWAHVLDEAAQMLHGQASTGTRFDAPQLRTTINGTSVTITLDRPYGKQRKSTAIAEAQVAETAKDIRLYFAWNITDIREELKYIPELDLPHNYGLPSPYFVRSSDSDFAHKLLKLAANDITGIRRESSAHGIEFLLRAGNLRLAVHGLERSEWVLERLATSAVRIVNGINTATKANLPLKLTVPRKRASGTKCRLCGEVFLESETVLRCDRCNTSYHQTCWRQATGCIVEDCYETRATPES
ncbi:MAG: RING finger protein [Myxococcota bacterium]|nr:RING finger protein [Myxococcota bacterium]